MRIDDAAVCCTFGSVNSLERIDSRMLLQQQGTRGEMRWRGVEVEGQGAFTVLPVIKSYFPPMRAVLDATAVPSGELGWTNCQVTIKSRMSIPARSAPYSFTLLCATYAHHLAGGRRSNGKIRADKECLKGAASFEKQQQ